jgi:hypothetical protein
MTEGIFLAMENGMNYTEDGSVFEKGKLSDALNHRWISSSQTRARCFLGSCGHLISIESQEREI